MQEKQPKIEAVIENKPTPPAEPAASRPGRDSALDALVASLDAACDEAQGTAAGPAGDRVVAAIERACRQPRLLGEAQRRGDPEHYTRHLLHADPAGRYTLVALVWEPGQHSPVHGHHAWCGYGVVEGCLRDESFAYLHDVDEARPEGAVDREPGTACFAPAGLDGVHRLGNAGARRAVSIHAYGVEGARVSSHVNRIVPVVGG